MKLGYARVSTTDQSLDLQINALQAAGAEKIYKDRASGAKSQRPGLDSLLSHARKGDVIVIWRLDRLARSISHLIELMQDFDGRGIGLISCTENIDTTTPTGKLMFHICGAFAEFERNLIIERTNAGLEAARAQGIHGGRRRVLDDTKKEAIRRMLDQAAAEKKRPSFKTIGHVIGVSARTVRRFADGEY